MKIPLALCNLLHQKTRTAVAVAGVTFALILIFMQLGFYGSAENTATVFLSKLEFDVLLISPDYLDINRPGTFPRSRLYQAQGVADVEHVVPLYVAANYWRNVETRKRRNIMIVGVHLADRVFVARDVFRDRDMEAELDKLHRPNTALIDTRTRHYFGPRGVGQVTEVGNSEIEVVGQFTLGTGYGSDGVLIVSDQTFAKVFGGWPPERTSLGLIKLKPGADPDAAARELRRLYPDNEVRVRTHRAMEEQEKDYWLTKTSVGTIFALGVVVALVVGVVFVYQVMSGDIANRFREYATLKAMGYPPGYLSGVVLQQAVVYALGGYVPALLISLALYELGRGQANLPIGMTWGRVAAVLALALAMCVLSGLLALKKVKAADPADLF